MRIRCGKQEERAMMLTEVVIATSIIALMAAALVGSFNYGMLTMKLVRENQRATQILMEKVETIRLYSWTQVNTSGFIPSVFTDYFDPQSPQSSKGVRYYGFIRINNVPFNTAYSADMKQIQITLIWFSGGNISHVRSTSTFIAKDGIQNYVY